MEKLKNNLVEDLKGKTITIAVIQFTWENTIMPEYLNSL